MKAKLRAAGCVVFWLLIWQLAAMLVHNTILLVGPVETAVCLWRLAGTAPFWQSLGRSAVRIAGGFAIGSLAGLAAGTLAFRSAAARQLLQPFVSAVKAVPVASFVILAMIWAGSANLALIISALVVFPIVYINTVNGLAAADRRLLELAAVSRLRLSARLRLIWLPTLRPFLRSSLSVSIGMAWKSGVAAEVIGQPLLTVGNGLYRAKILLETGDLLAWTAAAVLASLLCEKAILYLFRERSRK